jgi:hypothetical protein
MRAHASNADAAGLLQSSRLAGMALVKARGGTVPVSAGAPRGRLGSVVGW